MHVNHASYHLTSTTFTSCINVQDGSSYRPVVLMQGSYRINVLILIMHDNYACMASLRNLNCAHTLFHAHARAPNEVCRFLQDRDTLHEVF